MYGNKNSNNVANFCSIVLFCSLFLSNPVSWAQTRFSTDPVSPAYFHWLVLISMTFVQGAMNGLIVLVLRNYKHEYSGSRWTQAFWAGFPVAFIVTHFLILLIESIHNQVSLTQLGPLILSIWLGLFLSLNFILVFRISVWAAHEN